VVVPSCRPDSLKEFLAAWDNLFQRNDVGLFVVEDQPPWKDIPEFIPRRTDMIRSWGFYLAWKAGYQYILTLDDDVRPAGNPFKAYGDVFDSGAPLSPYLSVGALTTASVEMRGFPFGDRKPVEVALQYGGWNGVLDYDAPTQLAGVSTEEYFSPVNLPVPRSTPVTGCIMNCAFRAKYAPFMWQLPLLDGRYNRFGDIWSCLIAKRTFDWMGKAVVINGKASVFHRRASDPVKNMEREAPGIPVNEHLWEHLEEGDYEQVTESAYRYFVYIDREYAEHFRKSRDEWMKLFGHELTGSPVGSRATKRNSSSNTATGNGVKSAATRVAPPPSSVPPVIRAGV
jgi:hypothetical protein